MAFYIVKWGNLGSSFDNAQTAHMSKFTRRLKNILKILDIMHIV